MIKVRILTGMSAATAAAIAVPSLAGCTAGAHDDTTTTGTEQHLGDSAAGTGQLILHGYSLNYQSTSGGDEFVRVGEKMKVTVDVNGVLALLWPEDVADQAALADVKADPSTKLKLTAQLTYTKFDESKVNVSVPMTLAPGAGGVLTGTSDEFSIPKGIKVVSLDLSAEYLKAGATNTRSVFAHNGIQRDFNVFGAFLPNKLALFDTAGADKRSRIVEGGSVVPGSQLVVSVTDWRLDTVVDKTNLDLRFGRRHNYSRFGDSIVDAVGTLEYVVGAVVSTDGGGSYEPLALSKVDAAEIFGRGQSWRFAFQALKDIPGGAGPNVKVAFHVQAFLVVPHYYPGEIMDAKYAPDTRVLVKDVWDNNGGANYALPVGND